jgi:HPt (histidine-containing phosphotransfer) domain-containing protein
LNSNEYNGASRIAHSLKGALGSIHAERARHWAAALESATAAGDHERSRQCLISLEKTLAILQPELRPLLLG